MTGQINNLAIQASIDDRRRAAAGRRGAGQGNRADRPRIRVAFAARRHLASRGA